MVSSADAHGYLYDNSLGSFYWYWTVGEQSATVRLRFVARVFVVLPIITLSEAVKFLLLDYCEQLVTPRILFQALMAAEASVTITISTVIIMLVLVLFCWRSYDEPPPETSPITTSNVANTRMATLLLVLSITRRNIV